MSYYIGIDLGTSSVKLLLVDDSGAIQNSVTKEYPLLFPQPGWSEQEPERWWEAVTEGVRELTASIDRSQVAGIGCGGQMHGLVALDGNDSVIRPAILWNDGRTAEETAWLNTTVGKDKDFILLLAKEDEIVDGVLDTGKVKAFRVPKGLPVEVYATTLHYAPCHTCPHCGFRVAVVLPKGTNTEKPVFEAKCEEDTWMTARNKWLLAHPESKPHSSEAS